MGLFNAGIGGNTRTSDNDTSVTSNNQAGQSQTGNITNTSSMTPVSLTGGGKGSTTHATVNVLDGGAVRGSLDLAGHALDNNTFLALAAMDGYAGAAAMSADMSSAAFEQSASVANRALDTVGGTVGRALGTVEYSVGRSMDLAGDSLYYARENNKDFLSGVVNVVKESLGFADRSQDRGYDFADNITSRAMDYSMKSVRDAQTAGYDAVLKSMTAQRDSAAKALDSVSAAQRDAQTSSNRALEQAAKLTRSDDTDTSQTMIKWIAGALITAAVAWALPKMMKR